jgi:hypothetical protein
MANHGFVGGIDLVYALLGIHPVPLDYFSLGLGTNMYARFDETLANSPAIDPVKLSDTVLALAPGITCDNIIKIKRSYFSGHVYNLQTDTGLFVADGIITHNCRCWVSQYTSME